MCVCVCVGGGGGGGSLRYPSGHKEKVLLVMYY